MSWRRIAPTVQWWFVFLIATVSLSQVFHASRQLTGDDPQANGWCLMGWGAMLLSSLTMLAYDSYIKAKAEGKLVRTFWLFEQFAKSSSRHPQHMEKKP